MKIHRVLVYEYFKCVSRETNHSTEYVIVIFPTFVCFGIINELLCTKRMTTVVGLSKGIIALLFVCEQVAKDPTRNAYQYLFAFVL